MSSVLASLALALSVLPQSGESRVRVVFTEDIEKHCGPKVEACAFPGEVCVIYVRPPRTWGDYDRQIWLGHELMHCLGGEHPEVWW